MAERRAKGICYNYDDYIPMSINVRSCFGWTWMIQVKQRGKETMGDL